MKFSLIIPAYNEAPVIVPTLKLLAEAFDRKHLSWEIIVVDNGSSDHTVTRVKEMQHANIKTLSLTKKGKGRALREGFRFATGDIVGFTDADLPITPSQILSAFGELAAGNEQIVIGSRLAKDSAMPGREWWRVGSSRFFNLLARTIVRINASDTQCPMKIMKRPVVDIFLSTKEDTWFFDLEFISIIERRNIPIREVAVVWNEHRYPDRKSKLSTVKDGIRAIGAMLRIRYRAVTKSSH